ncbi:hypothetical protein HUJ04_011355 [Dendroctonus ponderosae]|nr:hypothetical protein HUJ04_011355 [Dendroctonus ponderosae]
MKMVIKSLVLLVTTASLINSKEYVPCQEISQTLRFPCKCALGPVEEVLSGNPSLSVNCDRIVFPLDMPFLPYGTPVVNFSQKYAGHHSLPSHIFTASLPLRYLDLSHNYLRKLMDKMLSTIQNTLIELRLQSNLLGDTLNPIFSTSEFRGLKYLNLLDLSSNGIKAIEEGILDGCDKLQELYLDHNDFQLIPSTSLNGPKSLKVLSLSNNNIDSIKVDTFISQPNLETIDLGHNLISVIENGALSKLENIKTLKLSHNKLSKFNSDVFVGAESLLDLELSENFMTEFPTEAIKIFEHLKYLNLSSNLIQTLDNNNLAFLSTLQELDLSRNSLTNIAPGTFLGLKNLQKLDIKRVTKLVISSNVVRELSSATFQNFRNLKNLDLKRNWITNLSADAFVGLEDSLEHLDLSENKIMTFQKPPLPFNALKTLDLSNNYLEELPNAPFNFLSSLKALNLSNNFHLSILLGTTLNELKEIEVIDFSYCGLQSISPELFQKSNSLIEIYIGHNNFSEIPSKTFVNMPNLTVFDLSYNRITSIKQEAFAFVMNVKQLSLKGNRLRSFKGEYFNTGTNLEVLDISNNELNYLFPSSFRIHPRLKKIIANSNKLIFVPAELIANLQFIEYIDLSFNMLKAIDELDFARLPRLRVLMLSNNNLENLSQMTFHNSTQLQRLALSANQLERLGDRIFEGLIRLEELNLAINYLVDLPETIFERVKLQMLNKIILSRNKFVNAPFKALQRQYLSLNDVDLSHNNIEEIPEDNHIMVNIKKLDFSFNPLSSEALANIIGEPKTVRSLNLANTGISTLYRLETPFLKHLNLSYNNISKLTGGMFERTTLLETLDLSNNEFASSKDFSNIWKMLQSLKMLNISNNAIERVSNADFEGLSTLRYLSIHSLKECSKIEKTSFKNVPNLVELNAYGYPKIGYLDVNGILQNMPLLEKLNIETKDAAIGKDQLQIMSHPRLHELGIRGSRLGIISSGTLSGIKGPNVLISFINTSLTSIPPSLFFPVPRSSKTTLDVTGNQLTTLNVQLLTTLEDRRGDLQLTGLQSNPINCDCNSRALRRWLPSHMMTANIWLKLVMMN